MTKLSWALVGILGPLAFFFIVIGLFTNPLEGLWMNLGTELVGVLVTVLFVDRLIQHHQAKQWGPYRERGIARCRVLCNAVLSSLRSAGGWEPDFSLAREPDERSVHRKIVEFANEQIAPDASRMAAALTPQTWDTLHRNFSNFSQEIETIFLRFGQHLTPQQQESLDTIAHSLYRATMMPTTFREMFNRDWERQDLRKVGIQSLAESIQEIIRVVDQLSDALESDVT